MESIDAEILSLLQIKSPLNKYQILDEYGIKVEDHKTSLEITESLRRLSENRSITFTEKYDGLKDIKLKFYEIKK